MVVYIISGITKHMDINLHVLRNRTFLRESSILNESMMLTHICLEDEERWIGMCKGGERYETG